MSAKRQEVFNALEGERHYQLRKWGNLDERNSVGDFLVYMQRELNKARDAYYGPDAPNGALDGIRKVTAVGVAAMERFGAPQRAA